MFLFNLKRRLIKILAPPLVSSILKLIYKSIKWEIEGEKYIKGLKEPVIFSFFHGRMAMLAFLYQKIRGNSNRIKMILSPHFDGEVASRIVRRLGIESIYGSSSKKGVQLLRDLIKIEGFDIGITPDGPRGPKEKVKPGVIYIAKEKGYPIVPVTYSVSKCKILNSWDSFMIPLPFCRGVYVIGEPIFLPQDLEKEDFPKFAKILEDRMKEVQNLADQKTGVL